MRLKCTRLGKRAVPAPRVRSSPRGSRRSRGRAQFRNSWVPGCGSGTESWGEGEVAGNSFISHQQRFKRSRVDPMPHIIRIMAPRGKQEFSDGREQKDGPKSITASGPCSPAASRVSTALSPFSRPDRTCLGEDELQDERSPSDDSRASGKEVPARNKKADIYHWG